MKYFFSKILFIFILGFLSLQSCKDKNKPIPNTVVDFYININDVDYSDLQAVGNSIYVYGGVAGIILYRESTESIIALDRCCSFNPDDRCAVKVDSVNSFILVCPCCSSEFIINNGSVNKSPAQAPLKQYQTSFDGEILHVFN